MRTLRERLEFGDCVMWRGRIWFFVRSDGDAAVLQAYSQGDSLPYVTVEWVSAPLAECVLPPRV